MIWTHKIIIERNISMDFKLSFLFKMKVFYVDISFRKKSITSIFPEKKFSIKQVSLQ